MTAHNYLTELLNLFNTPVLQEIIIDELTELDINANLAAFERYTSRLGYTDAYYLYRNLY